MGQPGSKEEGGIGELFSGLEVAEDTPPVSPGPTNSPKSPTPANPNSPNVTSAPPTRTPTSPSRPEDGRSTTSEEPEETSAFSFLNKGNDEPGEVHVPKNPEPAEESSAFSFIGQQTGEASVEQPRPNEPARPPKAKKPAKKAASAESPTSNSKPAGSSPIVKSDSKTTVKKKKFTLEKRPGYENEGSESSNGSPATTTSTSSSASSTPTPSRTSSQNSLASKQSPSDTSEGSAEAKPSPPKAEEPTADQQDQESETSSASERSTEVSDSSLAVEVGSDNASEASALSDTIPPSNVPSSPRESDAANSVSPAAARTAQDIRFELITTKKAISKLYTLLTELQQHSLTLEKSQLQAVEEENFDEAESLRQKLVDARQETHKAEADILTQTSKLLELEAEFQRGFDHEVAQVSESIDTLQAQEQTQLLHKETLSSKLAIERRALDEQFQSRQDDLDNEERHIDSDLQTISEKEAKVAEQIEEQTQTLRADRNDWTEKLTSVQAEIDALLAQVKAKQEQQADFHLQIADIDSKISVVKSKFDRDLGKFAQSRDNINTKKLDLEKQKMALLLDKKNADTQVSTLEAEMAQVEGSIAQLQESLEHQRGALDSLKLDIVSSEANSSKLKETIDVNQAHFNKMLTMQSMATTMEAEITALSQQSIGVQTQIDTTKKQVQAIKQDLPELEQKKKKAASSQSFQEASRYKKEIEAKEADTVKLKKLIKELAAQEDQLKEQLETKHTELADLNSTIKTEQHSHDMARYEKLKAVICDALVAVKAAVRDENYQLAETLSTESELAKAEFGQIRAKYDLPDIEEPADDR